MFENVVATLEGGLIPAALSAAGGIQGLAVSGLAAGISLYMLLASLAVLRGIAGDGFGHIVTQSVKASLVWAAVTGALVGDIGSLALDIPVSLGANQSNIGATADDYIDAVTRKATEVIVEGTPEEGAGFLIEPGQAIAHYAAKTVLYIVAVIPIVIAYLFGAVIVTIGIFLRFALAITAAFAPLFVALLLYDSTRGMFFTWLGAALGYGISIVVIGIVAAAFLAVVPGVLSAIPSDLGAFEGENRVLQAVLRLLAMAGIGIVGIAFLMQAQGIGQALGGGGGGSGAGVVGAIIPSRYTIRSLTNAFGNGARGLGRGARATGRAAVVAGRGGASAARALADSNSRTRIFRAGGAATLAAGRMTRVGV